MINQKPLPPESSKGFLLYIESTGLRLREDSSFEKTFCRRRHKRVFKINKTSKVLKHALRFYMKLHHSTHSTAHRHLRSWVIFFLFGDYALGGQEHASN